ncbi:hypothetical protein ACQ4PT_013713 [Festuca glaucescens]
MGYTHIHGGAGAAGAESGFRVADDVAAKGSDGVNRGAGGRGGDSSHGRKAGKAATSEHPAALAAASGTAQTVLVFGIWMIKMGYVPSVPLKNLWKNRFKGLDLLELSSHFIPGQQEDAHEFLRCLLDNLHHCTLDPKSKGKPSSFDEESIVKHVFGGRLKSQLTCRDCGHCSETFEPFLDLSLEIDQVDDLIVALESFTKVEQIGDVENKLTCERCNVEVCKDKRLMLDKAPDVLTLQLKRFTTLDSSVEKIDKHVAYPSELDLKPFHSNPETEELKYDLYGVVEHSSLPNYGHYVCAIRSSPSSWHLMNDSLVDSITETSALRHEAYVLFYVRQGMFPWFSSLLEESTKTSQDEINNPERPSTRSIISICSVSGHRGYRLS